MIRIPTINYRSVCIVCIRLHLPSITLLHINLRLLFPRLCCWFIHSGKLKKHLRQAYNNKLISASRLHIQTDAFGITSLIRTNNVCVYTKLLASLFLCIAMFFGFATLYLRRPPMRTWRWFCSDRFEWLQNKTIAVYKQTKIEPEPSYG